MNMPMEPEDKKTLLNVALQSIKYGLEKGLALPVTLSDYSSALQEKRATFVTLKLEENLRGCIGMLEAVRPLVEDVADNAYAAAFRDPRFHPLTEKELSSLSISVSILSPSEPIKFKSEADLLNQIRPGIDGLVLADGHHRGTFLPAVWESLPNPKDFLEHLKLKAGLSPDHWSKTLTVKRYTTESIE